MTGWLADGSVRTAETVVTGVQNAPDAFTSLFTGGNTGKLLVQVED